MTGVQTCALPISLVFAAFLLPAGALGDRFGRRGALQVGLVIFLAASLLAMGSDTAGQVIFWRCLMGVGAALTMPATLSILTTVFPPEERARAIAIWSGFAGAGGAIGLLAGGLLLENFWWGSVFFVNVPIGTTTLILVTILVPTSRDTLGHPLDPVGGLLTAGGLTGLVYGLIQGPDYGWTDPLVLTGLAAAVILLTAWVCYARRQQHPRAGKISAARPNTADAPLSVAQQHLNGSAELKPHPLLDQLRRQRRDSVACTKPDRRRIEDQPGQECGAYLGYHLPGAFLGQHLQLRPLPSRDLND